MYLLFDVSANGRPKSWSAPFTDTFNWPQMLHLSWILYDSKGALLEDEDRIVKVENVLLTEKIEKINHLTNQEIEQEGEELEVILTDFDRAVREANYIITFNRQFQENIVKSEFFRLMKEMNFGHAESFCLMRESTYFCKLPGKKGGYKWPTLPELHKCLFGKSYEKAGNARADVKALSRSFNRMMKLGELEDWW